MITNPYKRTLRPNSLGRYGFHYDYPEYVSHPKFADKADLFLRGFNLLQNDVISVFEYVEPADQNLRTFSLRNQISLTRICIELEANWKAILRENGYKKAKNWTIEDYRKIEKSHRLSDCRVRIPSWMGSQGVRQPFAAWASSVSNKLDWYQAYNSTKHDRASNFSQATFEHLVDSFCALVITITAQFGTEDFTLENKGPATLIAWDNSYKEPEFIPSIGSRFEVALSRNWNQHELYNVDWNQLKNEQEPFQEFRY